MATTLFGVMPGKISAQILALKSFYAVENSATLQNALSEEGTLFNLSKRKLDLQLSLEPGSQLSQISNISQGNGKEIVMKSDYLEYPLQESWTMESLMEDLEDLIND